jgi:hypothetical protein
MSGRNNVNTNLGGVESFLDLVDTPKSYNDSALLYCQVNADQTGLKFAPASGTGVTEFTELTDCPSTYAGSNNYQVVVNGSATGLVFQPGGPGVTEFIECTDTPETYAGTTPYDIVCINGASNGVRFASGAVVASNQIPLTSLQDYQQAGYTPVGGYLTSTGTGWIVTAPPEYPGGVGLNILDNASYSVSIPGAGSTDTYLINVNPQYIQYNEGFLISTPNNFSPIKTHLFNLNWSVSGTLSHSGFSVYTNTLVVALYTNLNVLVATLLTQNIDSVSVPSFPPLHFTYSGTTDNVSLQSGTEYQIRMIFTNNAASSIWVVSYTNKSFNFVTSEDFFISEAQDYLSSGYPIGVMFSNGVNGFFIGSGTNGDVLQIVDGAPDFAPISDVEIPDPLLINTINEKTLGVGTTINNTNMTTSGVEMINSLYPGASSPTLLNTYIQSGLIEVQWADSNDSAIVITDTNIQLTKIGNQVTVRFQRGNSYPATLSTGASYLVCSFALPSGYIPINTLDNPSLCSTFPIFGSSSSVGSGSVFGLRYNIADNRFEMGNYGTSNFGFGSIGNGQTVLFNDFYVTYLTN